VFVILPLPPVPVATQRTPVHATASPTGDVVAKKFVPRPVQFMPSFEYAIVFVPLPTATHREPFHAIPFP